MDVVAIHEALSAQVVAGTGREVRGYPFQTGGSYELPCVVVCPGEDYIDYHADMGTECDMNLILEVRVDSRTSIEEGLRKLSELLSADAGLPNSVIDAIESDVTLGGVVGQVVLGGVGQWGGFGATEEGGLPHGVMVTIPVQIWTSRS